MGCSLCTLQKREEHYRLLYELSQVNGGHEGAVESHRKEPIVVQVLRRHNGRNLGDQEVCVVSVATQTDITFEHIMALAKLRPPTPPVPDICPFLLSDSCHSIHTMEYFECPEFQPAGERQEELEYEEVVLCRHGSDEKLGLTLCCRTDEDQEEIYIGQVCPNSIAGRDGRIREGDRILQVNGRDVQGKDEALALLSGDDGHNITLLIARTHTQEEEYEDCCWLDEDHSEFLEELRMEILRDTQTQEQEGTCSHLHSPAGSPTKTSPPGHQENQQNQVAPQTATSPTPQHSTTIAPSDRNTTRHRAAPKHTRQGTASLPRAAPKHNRFGTSSLPRPSRRDQKRDPSCTPLDLGGGCGGSALVLGGGVGGRPGPGDQARALCPEQLAPRPGRHDEGLHGDGCHGEGLHGDHYQQLLELKCEFRQEGRGPRGVGLFYSRSSTIECSLTEKTAMPLGTEPSRDHYRTTPLGSSSLTEKTTGAGGAGGVAMSPGGGGGGPLAVERSRDHYCTTPLGSERSPDPYRTTPLATGTGVGGVEVERELMMLNEELRSIELECQNIMQQQQQQQQKRRKGHRDAAATAKDWRGDEDSQTAKDSRTAHTLPTEPLAAGKGKGKGHRDAKRATATTTRECNGHSRAHAVPTSRAHTMPASLAHRGASRAEQEGGRNPRGKLADIHEVPEKDKDTQRDWQRDRDSSSAYNTADSSRSTPLGTERSPDHHQSLQRHLDLKNLCSSPTHTTHTHTNKQQQKLTHAHTLPGHSHTLPGLSSHAKQPAKERRTPATPVSPSQTKGTPCTLKSPTRTLPSSLATPTRTPSNLKSPTHALPASLVSPSRTTKGVSSTTKCPARLVSPIRSLPAPLSTTAPPSTTANSSSLDQSPSNPSESDPALPADDERCDRKRTHQYQHHQQQQQQQQQRRQPAWHTSPFNTHASPYHTHTHTHTHTTAAATTTASRNYQSVFQLLHEHSSSSLEFSQSQFSQSQVSLLSLRPSRPGGGAGETTHLQWRVKVRADGSRCVARRPVRDRILRERALRIREERTGMTTDEDGCSELKMGRYWSREERKQHLARAREQRRRREFMQRSRVEWLREAGGGGGGGGGAEVSILELSQRKMLKRRNRRILDNWMTIQELMTQRVPEGTQTHNAFLSITTV